MNLEQENYKNLTPFKFWTLTNFPFIEQTFDSLTNYELLCKLGEYLNNLEYNQNAVQNNMTNLYTYVIDYFKNLDVTDEINVKLDKLAEDGTLTNLISSYINPFIEAQNNKINLQDTRISIIDEKANAATSGSPAGVYDTLAELQSADPDHSKIYLVLEDGEWYFWNIETEQWKNGGVYQAVTIADKSVTPEKTTFLELSIDNLWIPYPNINNGVTIGFNNEGYTTISGQAITNAFRQLVFNVHLEAGTYSIRAFDYSGNKPAIYGHKNDSNSDIVVTIGKNDYGKVFTIEEDSDIYFKTYEVLNDIYDYNGKLVLTKIDNWQSINSYIKPYYILKDTNTITKKDTATYDKKGIVKPDGQTIFINNDGTISTTGVSFLQGKKLSICGVSVDTFLGYIPSENSSYYNVNNLISVENTWWMKLLNKTGMTLLKNNSFSGSTVTTQQDLLSSGVHRCLNLDDGVNTPDIIIIGAFGLNDWLRDENYGNYTVNTLLPDINVDLTDNNNYALYKDTIETYEGALATMFKRIQQKYPSAKILTMDSYPYYRHGANPIGDVNRNIYKCNESLYKVAGYFGIPIIKISTCGINSENARNYCVEGINAAVALHPNAEGQTMLYKEVLYTINKYIN